MEDGRQSEDFKDRMEALMKSWKWSWMMIVWLL
jgi:hypothetical protein